MEAEERRKLKQERKREEILRAAARAFARKGYYGTSMEDISDELLMTKGSLYYYFKDKEHILFECHDLSLNLVLENLSAVQDSGLAADEKLARLIVSHVDVMLGALQGSTMALDFHALSRELYDRIIAKRDVFERGLRNIIEEGIEKGIFRQVDSKLAVFMIMGAINWVAKWYREGGRYRSEDIGPFFAELFIGGLKNGGLEAVSAGMESMNVGLSSID